jgi:hydroxymethylglutaryl-CoA reductase (NADPH)
MPASLADVEDASLLHLLAVGALSPHSLEAALGDALRAVALRRAFTAGALARLPAASRPPGAAPEAAVARIPYAGIDAAAFYGSVLNTNCESVVGFIPYPLGIVGPLPVDGREYRVPLATTEGALIASTNRGAAAIRRAQGGAGATTALLADGMTRAPLVRLPSLKEAAALVAWLAVPRNKARVADAFASTSRFGRLQELSPTLAGRSVFLRFKCFTGDAMGMNMITKGVNEALLLIK